MKERPILFSGPMVRALLDGRKTQTRRIVKPQPERHIVHGKYEPHDPFNHHESAVWGWMCGKVSYTDNDRRCPYGVPGDGLWVREAWAEKRDRGRLTGRHDEPSCVWYRADADYQDVTLPPGGNYQRRWRPSIHMPRWAARILLEITAVRVERVRDISGADAFAEGVQIPVSEPNVPLLRMSSRVPFEAVSSKHPRAWGSEEFARFEFLHLFYDINRRAPVEANPWVWALTFRVVA